MATDINLLNESTTNPCCSLWKDTCLKLQQKNKKLEDARAALKKAVGIYEQQFDKMQDESLKLKKAYAEEKLQADFERKEKERESAARVSMEHEISTLKSEILSLSQRGGLVSDNASEELALLKQSVMDKEKEIGCLQEENKRAKAEQSRIEREFSNLNNQLVNAESAQKKLMQDLQKERARADSEKKRADETLKTAKTKQTEVEALKEIGCLQEENKRAKAEQSRIERELSKLNNQLVNAESAQKKLMQDLQKERARADSEKKRADETLKTAKTKQTEVEALKAEKKKTELCVPTSEIRNLETEIVRLKELFENERIRADCETKKAETEKKSAHRLKEMLKTEQSRANEQRKLVDVERKKAQEFANQLQRSKCEAEEAKSKLDSEGLKVREANKKFEAEKKRSIKEKKKAEEQQKIAEMSTKHALEEKQKAARLQQQLEDCQNEYKKLKKNMENYETNMKIHEQVKQKSADLDMGKEMEYKKAAETYKLQAMKEKSRADKLAQQLEDIKTWTKNEHRTIQDLVSSKNLTGTTKSESAEMKFLMKRLKHKKDRVNHYKDRAQHFKEVAELETKRKKTVEDELHSLKLEFARFSRRVGICSCFDICDVGKACVEKNGDVNSKRKANQTGSGKELAKPTKQSEFCKPNTDISTPSLPISGTCTESTSGTASKMEPLHNRKNLDSFALISSMASFSDRQLVVGTQENTPLLISRLPTENAEVADNNVKSPLKVGNKDGNTKKRKRVLNSIEGKTCHAKVAKNATELHGVLGQNDKPLAIEHDKEGTRTVDFNSLGKTRNDDLENFKKMFDGDCMKLLRLDDEAEEERYRAAVERPLSPALPHIEFESSLTVLDDSRPPESEMPVFAKESWSIVVFSDIRHNGNLSKIIHMTKNFTSHVRAFSQSDLVVQNVISTLLADAILSPKQKVCVFFSLFLKSFSGIASIDFDHASDKNFLSSARIISGQLKKVMSDVETRTRFSKVCDLKELITLIQRFLINGEILVCSTNTSSETQSLPESKASLHELVIGAVLLASICEAFGSVDFICELSYTISRVTSSSSLTLLHVFANVCGEKLLIHGDYNLIMTVIKSLVTYWEREHLSSGFPSCAKCPFSIGAVSMEELASLLLKKLSDRSGHMSGVMTCKSLTVPDDTLSDLGNVLSLLELVATKMSWGWVCKNIVSELLNLLEACAMETPLTANFVLLGQMARLGIDANGLEDVEVESIRVKLISFISQSTSRKTSLPVQFAAVNALMGTTRLSFQEICKPGLEHPPPVSSATECIQRWFCLQSDEGKSLSVRILTASCQNV